MHLPLIFKILLPTYFYFFLGTWKQETKKLNMKQKNTKFMPAHKNPPTRNVEEQRRVPVGRCHVSKGKRLKEVFASYCVTAPEPTENRPKRSGGRNRAGEGVALPRRAGRVTRCGAPPNKKPWSGAEHLAGVWGRRVAPTAKKTKPRKQNKFCFADEYRSSKRQNAKKKGGA